MPKKKIDTVEAAQEPRRLDRSRSFGKIFPQIDRAVYSQDDAVFDADDLEIINYVPPGVPTPEE